MFKKKNEKITEDFIETSEPEKVEPKVDTGFVDGDDETPVITKEERAKIEAQVKEEKAKKEAESNPNNINLEAKIEYTDDSLKAVEDMRANFLKVFSKQTILKWIIAGVTIALIIFAWLYVIAQLQMLWLGIVLVVVALLIMFAYYLGTKLYNKNKLTGYFDGYYSNINKFTFDNERFSDVNANITGKIDTADFAKNNLYKDVCTIGSRNVVTFKIDHKIEATICDCAAQVNTLKKLVPAFVGKHVVAPNNYKNENPIYIYFTGNDRALPPTNLGGVEKVMNTKKMEVYSNNPKYANTFNSTLKAALAKVITNNVLVDLAIAITEGTTYIEMGYDDNLMVLPLQQPFNPLPNTKFKEDLVVIADIIEALNK